MKYRSDRILGTPLHKKLGIREDARVAFPGAPDGFGELLGELPAGVIVKSRAGGPLDVIVFFTKRRAELERRLPALRRAIEPAAGLWIAWPKRSSGVETDMTEDVARELGSPTGSSTTRSARSTRPGRD